MKATIKKVISLAGRTRKWFFAASFLTLVLLLLSGQGHNSGMTGKPLGIAWPFAPAAVFGEEIAESAVNPCTNGSFEILAANGFPKDWGYVGREVSVSSDAHSGERSLRMVRTAETTTSETGLNRAVLIKELKGGMDFWYKAVSASGAKLNIYVIPVNEEGVEKTGSPRATFTVPEDHIGDGQWHHARLKYDYTDNPKVKSVHFAARIVGTAGELLLDDMQYVAAVGPLPQIKKLSLEEDAKSPGARGRLRVLIGNAGDQAAEDLDLLVELPQGLQLQPAKTPLGTLAPDETKAIYLAVVGPRTQAGKIRAVLSSRQFADERSLAFAPLLRVRSFGPKEPVVAKGQAALLECELENAGHAIITNVGVNWETPAGPGRQVVTRLLPGQRTVVRHSFIPTEEGVAIPLAVRVESPGVAVIEGSDGRWEARSALSVVASISMPQPQPRLVASPTPIPTLGNEYFRLVFFPCEQRFFAARLEINTPQGWQAAGWLVSLGRLAIRDSQGQPEEHLLVADSCTVGRPKAFLSGDLLFHCPLKTRDGGTVNVAVNFELRPNSPTLEMQAVLESDQPLDILAWGLPLLYIRDRDEAVFPGLEWLVDDELSSDSLDIAEDHPDRIRFVVHPQMITIPAVGIHGPYGTVGLVWDIHQKWDGKWDRPAFAFASPDRFDHQRGHLMELFVPSVPEFTPVNRRVAEKPYRLQAGNKLQLRAGLFVDGKASDALVVIEDYVKVHKIPLSPLPHTSYPGEIVFSARAYLESLWDAEKKLWWTTKGNALLSQQGLPSDFAADLALATLLSHDPAFAQRCRQRVEEVAERLQLPPRLDALRIGARADRVWANATRIAALLATRQADGSWRFDADRPGSGPFVGMDYAELGPDDALEVGTCARNAYEILAYARITDDRSLYEEMIKTLELMEQFRVPRAAQVWEVPVHTPDILAAADAVDAYLEAYRISGEKRWLGDAILWARRGLPFVYLWNDPDRPYLVGASIPVFGATWYHGSWFGRPVQWNGLRYANAILKLAEYDQSLPWRQIAESLIRSALHQQDQEGENVALWPDNISAIDGQKCPWVFAPRQIISCIGKLIGRDEEPATVYVPVERGRLAITSLGKIAQVELGNRGLEFSVTFPPGEVGPVVVANLARPEEVLLDGQPLPKNDRPHLGETSAWCYDPATALLTIQVAITGPARIAVKPIVGRLVDRIPRLVTRIDFQFEAGTEGWIAAHDVADLEAADGRLRGRISGPDPYIVRPMVRVSGDQCSTLQLRLAIDAGRMAQLFWTTESSPSFDEQKSLRFEVQPDGQEHDYTLRVGEHPLWHGQTITGLRLDPGGGTPSGSFTLDKIQCP